MKSFIATVLMLLMAQSTLAQAASCPLAMITFVDGGIASPSNSNVRKIRDSFEEAFGPAYPIQLVQSSGELADYDYALSLTIEKYNSTLTVKMMDVLLGSAISTESVTYRNQTNLDYVLGTLAEKIKASSLHLMGRCK